MTDGYGIVRLEDLEQFQKDILQLSRVLDEYYNLVSRTLQATSQNWRDIKFTEFERDFRKYKDEIKNISEEYRTWAQQYLQTEIDNVKAFTKVKGVQ